MAIIIFFKNANSILSYHVIEWIYQNTVYPSTQSRYSKILISIPPSTIVETVTGSITLPASSQKDTWSFKYFIQRALPILVTMSIESSFTPIPPNFLIRYFSLIFKSTIGVHSMQTNQKHEETMHRKLRQKKIIQRLYGWIRECLGFLERFRQSLYSHLGGDMSCCHRKSFLVSGGLRGCPSSRLKAPESWLVFVRA